MEVRNAGQPPTAKHFQPQVSIVMRLRHLKTVISGNALLLAMLYYVYMCVCVLDGVSAFVNGNYEVS